MRIILNLSFIFQFISTICISQNLIINGDFEDVNICTEHNAPCSPEAWRLTSALLPEYSNNYGKHSVGIVVLNPSVKNIRSYLQSRLSFPLSKGKRYRLKMDICPGDIFINEIGIVFSDTIILTKEDILLKKTPDFEFKNNKKLLHYNKGKDWLRLEKEFVANSNALFMIIGSFLNDDELIYKFSSGKFKKYNNYFYYIDNVSVTPIDTICDNEKIDSIKNSIYSQNHRHPVPNDFLDNKEIVHENYTIPFIAETDTIILFDDLLFKFDSYILSKKLIKKMDSIFTKKAYLIDSILIIGHTDTIGMDSYNDDLSYERAVSIENYIIKMNYIEKEKISVKGLGSKFPINDNTLDFEFYKNRRVEIINYYSK